MSSSSGELFKCIICTKIATDTYNCVVCQALFCGECAKHKKINGTCSQCITEDSLKTNATVNNLIGQKKFMCPKKCGQKIRMRSMDIHTTYCKAADFISEKEIVAEKSLEQAITQQLSLESKSEKVEQIPQHMEIESSYSEEKKFQGDVYSNEKEDEQIQEAKKEGISDQIFHNMKNPFQKLSTENLQKVKSDNLKIPLGFQQQQMEQKENIPPAQNLQMPPPQFDNSSPVKVNKSKPKEVEVKPKLLNQDGTEMSKTQRKNFIKKEKLDQIKLLQTSDPNFIAMHHGLKEQFNSFKATYPKFRLTFEREQVNKNNLWSNYISDGIVRTIKNGLDQHGVFREELTKEGDNDEVEVRCYAILYYGFNFGIRTKSGNQNSKSIWFSGYKVEIKDGNRKFYDNNGKEISIAEFDKECEKF